jgi:hypothetical protein
MMKINLKCVEKKVLDALVETCPDDGRNNIKIKYEGGPAHGDITIVVEDISDYVDALKCIINCLEKFKE